MWPAAYRGECACGAARAAGTGDESARKCSRRCAGAGRLFIVVDGAEGDARGVIDDHMHLSAGPRRAILGAAFRDEVARR